jgi:hypothetical protein
MRSDEQIPYRNEDWLHEPADCSIGMSKAVDKCLVPEYLAKQRADSLASKLRGSN